MPVKTHKCAVEACEVRIPRDKLMCRMHWPMLTAPMRCEVNAAYRQRCATHESNIYGQEARARYSAAKEAAIKMIGAGKS